VKKERRRRGKEERGDIHKRKDGERRGRRRSFFFFLVFVFLRTTKGTFTSFFILFSEKGHEPLQWRGRRKWGNHLCFSLPL
jgi:hypothetical protein